MKLSVGREITNHLILVSWKSRMLRTIVPGYRRG